MGLYTCIKDVLAIESFLGGALVVWGCVGHFCCDVVFFWLLFETLFRIYLWRY